MKLTASLWLFLRAILFALFGAILFACLWQGYHENHWWTFEYIFSLAIPALVFLCLAWVAFVPSVFELSNDFLRIQFAFRKEHEINWSDLKFWGHGGQATFLLQFATSGTFQVALFAYPRNQRQQLIDFLKSNFPQRRARLWIGVWGSR